MRVLGFRGNGRLFLIVLGLHARPILRRNIAQQRHIAFVFRRAEPVLIRHIITRRNPGHVKYEHVRNTGVSERLAVPPIQAEERHIEPGLGQCRFQMVPKCPLDIQRVELRQTAGP